MSGEDPKFVWQTQGEREWFRIVPTEGGWDVVIPDEVTITEAAKIFIETVNEMLVKDKK
jgi:hypothetical protein